jgi:hypothetical protein
LALAERYGASAFTSTPDAGVLEKMSNAEVGPAETIGANEIKIQPATANGVRTLGYMTLVGLCQLMRGINAGYQCAEVAQAFSNKTNN